MTGGDGVGSERLGEPLSARPQPDPEDRPDRPAQDDDARHPARRLLRGRGAGVSGAGWASPGLNGDAGSGGAHLITAPSGAEPPGDASPRQGAARGRAPASGGRRTTLLAVLGLAVVVGGASAAVGLIGQSHPVPPVTPPAIAPLLPADAIGHLQMYSPTTGWAQRLNDGAILHTTAGVDRWAVASPPTADPPLAVAYLGADLARALTVPAGAGAQATLQAWSTQDGGATWDREGALSVQGFNRSIGAGVLDFVDAEHGWYSQIEAASGVAGSALYRTVDGGARWTEVAATSAGAPATPGVIPEGCAALTAAFVSVSTGWMTGTCLSGTPPFYVTHDGGATWIVATLSPVPAGALEETSFSPIFVAGGDGTVLTENDSKSGITTSLFATSDGGVSWRLQSTTDGQAATEDFLDAQHGWLVTDEDGVGSAPDLYATTDGGSSWTHVNAFPYEGLSLDFLTPTEGWAADDLGQNASGPTYLVQTVDGGRDWTSVLPRIGGASPSP